MNKSQHNQVAKHIEKIDTMDKSELQEFSRKWFMAKPDLDAVVFQWVLRAITIQSDYLDSRGNFSVMVEMSDVLDGDRLDLC